MSIPWWPGQQVRVVRMTDWPVGTEDVTGCEGEVVAIDPAPDDPPRWLITVDLGNGRGTMSFEEHELAPVVPISDAPRLAPLLLEVDVRRRELEGISSRVAAALRAAIDISEIEETLHERDAGDVRIAVRIWPRGSATDAFETLLRTSGRWNHVFDDGWGAEAHWAPSRDDRKFLGLPASRVVLVLRPWDELRRRALRV